MNKNDSPRLSNKLYEIIKDIIANKNTLDKFTNDFLESLINNEDYNLPLIVNDGRYYFKGYPNGNYLKIFCKILDLWYKHGQFPISFFQVEGLKDQTGKIIELLNLQTTNLNLIFNFIKEKNFPPAYKLIINFFESIGMRGVLTCLGVRYTSGSLEKYIPKKENLYKSFNAIYEREKTNRMEDKNDVIYITKITVGARALSKHADRTKDNFWGICIGNEINRNIQANEILNKIMDECVWINIHYLPHSLEVIEIRNIKGYGVRFCINNDFRGLIEPEFRKDEINKKKEQRKDNYH